MTIEKRSYPRYKPQGLKASVNLEQPFNDLLRIQGEVIDISFTGIKIKLESPISADLEGKIKINLRLPECGIGITISGIIKHQHNPGEYGVHYIKTPSLDALDDFILECVKNSRPKSAGHFSDQWTNSPIF
ncbi:PilZ domain-containing protein [Candidatus Methylobacter favarea]|uniref:PilZ domain-containing protein n=1 Tax=Candidatus Methylobacter favarea TaxID=2707345 RepID=A0A8S0Y625_9GAMM|nr:PilZ domain-containing protein [Candidatus Methylobacter favarea]CAA9890320.1 PilZ domain-containing protein [Candidatus Methylobacter favarea]